MVVGLTTSDQCGQNTDLLIALVTVIHSNLYLKNFIATLNFGFMIAAVMFSIFRFHDLE